MSKILEICIPTYNRLKQLDKLIKLLKSEIEENYLEDNVQISIYNNSENDILSWDKKYIKLINNEKNIGGAFNIIKCMENASLKYVWVLGDDDYPMIGILNKIVKYLLNMEVDLFFIDAKWNIEKKIKIEKMKNDNEIIKINKFDYCRFSGDKITFISSCIYNRKQYLAIENNYRRYAKTSLPQLEVYLTLINKENCKIVKFKRKSINAVGGEGGGYNLMNVFNNEIYDIVNEKIDNKQMKKIILKWHKALIIRMIVGQKIRQNRNFSLNKEELNQQDGVYKRNELVKFINESVILNCIRYLLLRLTLLR